MHENDRCTDFTEALLNIFKDKKKKTKKTEIEIEIRFGKIMDKDTSERMDLDVLHPMLMEELAENYFFVSGVDEKDFNNIQRKYKDHKSTDTKDRVVFYNKNRYRCINNKIVDCIRKVKISHHHIYNPFLDYDIRISISNEFKMKFSVGF